MNNSSIKHPNPNSLPINPLARTQSAPPEGKIHEFQDLKDKTNQFQNKNQESNQQVPKVYYIYFHLF